MQQSWNRPNHGKGKGKGKGYAPLHLPRDVESRIDPQDVGNLPPRLLPLSRKLATFLRHRAGGIREIDDEGWTPIQQVLALEDFREYNHSDLRTVVEESFSKDKPRFEIKTREDDVVLIRAAHKRGFYDVEATNRRPAVRQRWQPRQHGSAPPLPNTIPSSANDDEETFLSVPTETASLSSAQQLQCFDMSAGDSDDDSPAQQMPSERKKEGSNKALAPLLEDQVPSLSQLLAEDCKDSLAEEPAPFAPGLSSTGTQWAKATDPVDCWWCQREDGQDDFFLEADPLPWRLHQDPELGSHWLNEDTEEFFFV